MMILPELPWDKLREDYFKGMRSQIYRDSDGVHQFEKRLHQRHLLELRAKELKKEYKYKYGIGTQESKYINSFLIKEFGKWWIDEYSILEDSYFK